MPTSRRSFLRVLGTGSAGAFLPFVTARGLEAFSGSGVASPTGNRPGRVRAGTSLIRLDSNENPNGPSPVALDALHDMLGEANRYPRNPESDLRAAVARLHGVTTAEVSLGCGSGEVLRMATEAFTSGTRALVTASPTFENPAKIARRMGSPVREVRVDAKLRLDLDAMLRESADAGLVFFCNPNNPTGTVHGVADARRFIGEVLARSPGTTVLVDEAYFEYVDDPRYDTLIPMAIGNPRVIVTRTFSKVFGLAGLRVGYAVAHADTIARLEAFRLASSVNVLGAAAAAASLGLRDHIAGQQALNRAARAFTVETFNQLGFPCQPSQTNFVMVDIGRDVKAFQSTCLDRGVAVGRPFPPLDTFLRLSIGTMDEMKRAMSIIGAALRETRAGAGR
jgi:histidinol-phosphate aminotransferase